MKRRTDFPKPEDCVDLGVNGTTIDQINENVDKLTPKERAALAFFLQNPVAHTKNQALIEAGYKYNRGGRATTVFKRIETKLGVSLSEFFRIGMEDAARIIVDAMQATKQIVTQRKFYREGKLTRIESVITHVPDHNMRLKALSLVIRSKPTAPKDDKEIPFTGLKDREAVAATCEVGGAN